MEVKERNPSRKNTGIKIYRNLDIVHFNSISINYEDKSINFDICDIEKEGIKEKGKREEGEFEKYNNFLNYYPRNRSYGYYYVDDNYKEYRDNFDVVDNSYDLVKNLNNGKPKIYAFQFKNEKYLIIHNSINKIIYYEKPRGYKIFLRNGKNITVDGMGLICPDFFYFHGGRPEFVVHTNGRSFGDAPECYKLVEKIFERFEELN